MIHCTKTPQSIFKAALLAELTDDLPCLGQEEAGLGLFQQTDILDANNYELTTLLDRCRTDLSMNCDWLLQYQGHRLTLMVLMNMRVISPNSMDTIFSALREAFRHGAHYCIYGMGPASRIFRKRSRLVGQEIHRMLGLIRFQTLADHTLVAHPKLLYDTADWILRKMSSRYPGKRLAFFLETHVVIFEKGIIKRAPLEDFDQPVLNDGWDSLWQTYYRSQYIPARKNLKLASRFVPKRYWDDLAEGSILREEDSKP